MSEDKEVGANEGGNEERTILDIKYLSRTVKYGIWNETFIFIFTPLFSAPRRVHEILLTEAYSIKIV